MHKHDGDRDDDVGDDCYYYSASTLLAMQTAVIARPILSVCLSVRPLPSGVLSRRMKIRSCDFQHQGDNHSSFWRGNVYPDIRRDHP